MSLLLEYKILLKKLSVINFWYRQTGSYIEKPDQFQERQYDTCRWVERQAVRLTASIYKVDRFPFLFSFIDQHNCYNLSPVLHYKHYH